MNKKLMDLILLVAPKLLGPSWQNKLVGIAGLVTGVSILLAEGAQFVKFAMDNDPTTVPTFEHLEAAWVSLLVAWTGFVSRDNKVTSEQVQEAKDTKDNR